MSIVSHSAAEALRSAEEQVHAPERFDYSGWEHSLSERAKAAAEHIRQNRADRTRGIIEDGRWLIAIKYSVPFGQWVKWLEAEVDMSIRSAQNRISVAEIFAKKSETVSYLPAKILYSLAARNAPKAAVAAILARFAAGERPPPNEIRRLIFTAREAEKTKASKLREARLLRQRRAYAPAHARTKLAEKQYRTNISQQAADLIIGRCHEELPKIVTLLYHADLHVVLGLLKNATRAIKPQG